MYEVACLTAGQSFGQDSLLSEQAKKRNATCSVHGDKVITAILTKQDFQRVLYEQERIKIEGKLSNIELFGLFNSIHKRKLR